MAKLVKVYDDVAAATPTTVGLRTCCAVSKCGQPADGFQILKLSMSGSNAMTVSFSMILTTTKSFGDCVMAPEPALLLLALAVTLIGGIVGYPTALKRKPCCAPRQGQTMRNECVRAAPPRREESP